MANLSTWRLVESISIAICARLVPAADRPRAGHGPRDGREVRLGSSRAGQNQPNLPTGSDDPKPATLPTSRLPNLPTGSSAALAESDRSKPATQPADRLAAGPASKCEPLRELIPAKLEEGLTRPADSPGSGRRRQPASATTACGGSCSGWDARRPLPFRRMECGAGRRSPGRLRHAALRSSRRTASGARRTSSASC